MTRMAKQKLGLTTFCSLVVYLGMGFHATTVFVSQPFGTQMFQRVGGVPCGLMLVIFALTPPLVETFANPSRDPGLLFFGKRFFLVPISFGPIFRGRSGVTEFSGKAG